MKQLYLILFLFSAITVSAQNDTVVATKSNSKLKVSEVSVFTGRLFYDESSEDFDSFESIALKNSDAPDFANWDKSSLFGDVYSYGLNISLSPYNEFDSTYNHRRKLVFGINFKNGDRRMFKYSNETNTPYGMLQDTNSVEPQSYSKDSTVRQSYIFREGTQEITLNSSFLLFTDPKKIISFNTGLGINVGFSLNSSIIEGSLIDSLLSISNSDGRYYQENEANPEWEYQYNDTQGSLFLRAYLPLGINLRMSKESDVLNQLTFFAQGLIGYEFQYIYSTTSFSRFYWGAELGIRHFF